MVGPMNTKVRIGKELKEAIERLGSAEYEKVVADICLRTGFTEAVVKKIISQLETIGDLKIETIEGIQFIKREQ